MSYNPFWNGTDYNPIISVGGVALPKCPSAFDWEEEDLSNANSGRAEDGGMDKNRIGTITGLKLEWQNIPLQTAHKILKMFAPEYITVEYINPADDSQYGYRREEVFYVGNRTLKVKNGRLNICERVAFNLISRYPHQRS